jgi:hydrogenase nickel incorporation protein HypB
MCATCGCGHTARTFVEAALLRKPTSSRRRIDIETNVLASNAAIALRNRAWLNAHGIVALNLMSSPGSGKTTLLEHTLLELKRERAVAVVEGDQETALDAERIRATGCMALQINTGTGCHLEAAMIAKAIESLAPPRNSLLFIENVGNLVCPALFDLGERAKVVMVSVTEGDDKPRKYPHMFRAATVVLLNKVDLLPYVPFDLGRFTNSVRHLNAHAPVVTLSALNGQGMAAWYDWVRSQFELPTTRSAATQAFAAGT